MSNMHTDIGIADGKIVVKITMDDDDRDILIEMSRAIAIEIGRGYMLAAEAATTGTIDPDGLTPMERLAIEMCARLILLRGGCNSHEDALIRAKEEILDPARRWQ